MSIFAPIQAILEVYDQPFFKKPALACQNLFLQQQLAEWVHQIYFDHKKLNQLSVNRLVQHPLDSIKPNIACSIMYSIIRQKVQEVCKSIRELVIMSYRKLGTKKQMNCDLKHSSDSWNMNFYKFRKASIQTNLNKVYGPIAHIMCTYHNSLLDCNKQVYDLWKLLYQCSQIKDLEFKTLQSSLNQLILQQLMNDYPNSQMSPKQIMPTLSSFQKHQFIFKQMWGFQKRKLAVQFHSKGQETVSDLSQKQSRANKQILDPTVPKKVEKGKVLSPPKPIPISLKQVGINTNKLQKQLQHNKILQKQLAKKKAIDDQIHLVQLQQLVQGLDSQTRLKIFRQVLDYNKQPCSDKPKQQTFASISKIILGNLSINQKKLLEQRLSRSLQAPIQLTVDQSSESNQSDDCIFQQNKCEDKLIDQQQTIELQKMQGSNSRQLKKQWQPNIMNYFQEKQENSKIFSQLRQTLERINQNSLIFQFQSKNLVHKSNQILQNQAKNIQQSSNNKQKLPDLIPINKKRHYQPIQNIPYNLKFDEGKISMQQSFLQKLTNFTDPTDLEDIANEKQILKGSKKFEQKQFYFGRNIELLSALSNTFDEKDKTISQSISSCLTNGKMSRLQKMSQQEIVDQIYQIAKQKQKRGDFKKSEFKMTYKKISYQLKSGDQKNQIKISKGSLSADDFQNGNWLQDLQQQTKYQLNELNDYNDKLIDQPQEDMCPDDKQQKKKKKKKKKKNKNKKQEKQVSDENQLQRKGSISSFNDQCDLECLQQFKRKSIVDMLDFKKMFSLPQGIQLHQYLENSEELLRTRQQLLMMQKRMQIYQKQNQKLEKSELSAADAGLSKDKKIKKQILNEQELKLFKFLQNLQIKDQNREKCVVTEQTIQKILYKRKQIKSKEVFKRHTIRTQNGSLSIKKVQSNLSSERKNDLSNPKNTKTKNKKKKK